MRKTVAKILCNGWYRVVYDDTKYHNPYEIYKEYDNNHSKMLVEYADLTSCMYYLTEEVIKH